MYNVHVIYYNVVFLDRFALIYQSLSWEASINVA